MTPYNVSEEKEELCPPVTQEHATGTRSDSSSLQGGVVHVSSSV